MHLALSALIGAALGLGAALLTRARGPWLALDAAVGTLGAVPAAWFLAPLSGSAAGGRWLSGAELFGAIVGAVFLLSLWVLCRPGAK